MQEDGRAETEERALSSSPGRGQSRQNCWDGKMWEDQSENSREKTRGRDMSMNAHSQKGGKKEQSGGGVAAQP